MPEAVAAARENGVDPVELPDSLWVTPWPSLDTCEEAQAAPAVTSGAGLGWAVDANADMLEAGCFLCTA